MRGQVEFIVVLGIVVVIVVVAFYALQTGIIPAASANPDVRLVQDSTNNFIRNAAYDTLRKVSDNGGYLEPQASGVTFLGMGVPYWARNGQLMVPNVQQNIVTGITNYITNNKDNFASSVSGKAVTLGQPQVTVNVLENQLSITVYMPTTVNDVQVPQPYVVSVPTKIGEVIDFSSALAQNQLQNRYLEYFIISSMLLSPYDGPAQVVPTHIYLTTCGEFVFKSWFDVAPQMEEVIKTTLGHTYMPDKYPMNVEKTSNFLKYAIPEMSGKKHFDLNVSFDVPDGFSLSYQSMQMDPDPVLSLALPIPMTGLCQSDPVNVKYYLQFPAIARIRDPLTGNIMRFAIDTYIKDNMPGSWGAGGYNQTLQTLICSNPQCDASIKVLDVYGKPVSGATVTYMGCGVGQTGSSGIATGKVPCGSSGPIEAYRSGFDVFSRGGFNNDMVRNTTIVMTGMPTMNAHLYEAIVETMGSFGVNGSSYMIPASGIGVNNLPGINPINALADERKENEMVYLQFQSLDTGKIYERFFTEKVGIINGVPSGSYILNGALTNQVMTALYGGFSVNIGITDSMDGKDIYIYLPYSYAYSRLTDRTSKINGGLLLTNMLVSCGIGPVAGTEYTGALPCSKGIGDL